MTEVEIYHLFIICLANIAKAHMAYMAYVAYDFLMTSDDFPN